MPGKSKRAIITVRDLKKIITNTKYFFEGNYSPRHFAASVLMFIQEILLALLVSTAQEKVR